MNFENIVKNKSIVIATHVYATGPSHALEDFLKIRVKNLLFIGHPFVFAKDPYSHLRYYKKNKLVKERHISFFIKNQIYSIVKDIILTLIWIIGKKKYDVYVGVDNINAIVGILLKKIGIVKSVVFYTIDYVPMRFKNPLLNNLYHFIDAFAVKHSDYVWNLSSIMVSEREKKGIAITYRKKQLIVPMGTESDMQSVPFAKIYRYHVAHMGHLIEKQGVQLVIKAIPLVIKRVPKFHLEIIGGGEYEGYLQSLAKKEKVEKYITFHGYVRNHKKIEKMLSYCSLGIAPYVDSDDNYIRYSDPGKVKAYLSAGLPVIITKVPEIATYLAKEKAGLAIAYSKEDINNALITLLTDTKLLKQYRKNAKKIAKEYSWEKIFQNALEPLL